MVLGEGAMMPVRVEVAPALLQWAVERAGWDDATAAQRVPKLGAWLTGDSRPTLKELQAFARRTHAPFGLLFLRDPPVEEIPIPDMRTVGSTRLARPSADLLETIYICQRRQDWFRSFAQENGLEPLSFVGSVSLKDEAATVASEMRENFELDPVEPLEGRDSREARRSLTEKIEDAGVLVMVNGIVGADTHRKLQVEEFRGFALGDDLAPLLFVNGSDAYTAQVFTMVHEFAHLWLGNSALSDAVPGESDGHAEELWCNAVAAEFVVPMPRLRADYAGSTDVEELRRLSGIYHVSSAVILKRLFDGGFLQWADYRARYDEEAERVRNLPPRSSGRGGGQFYATQPWRLGRSFAQAVVGSTLSGDTSYRDAYKLLGIKKHRTFTKLAEELGVG